MSNTQDVIFRNVQVIDGNEDEPSQRMSSSGMERSLQLNAVVAYLKPTTGVSTERAGR